MNSPSNLSNQSEYPYSSVHQDVDKLLQSFEMIAALAEEEVRQEKIREVAAALEISEVAYLEHFEHYLNNRYKHAHQHPVPPILKPVSILDTKVSHFVDALKEVSLVKLATVLGESALLFAMISYIVTIPVRREQTIQKARQILLQSTEREYDESRIAALKVLDQRCAGNPGLVAPNAHLVNLKIFGCSRWSLRSQDINQNSFRYWQPMDLSYSVLTGANLNNAQLSGANLVGVDLSGANLQKCRS